MIWLWVALGTLGVLLLACLVGLAWFHVWIVRTYVPNATLLDGRYSLPDVARDRTAEAAVTAAPAMAAPVPA